MRKFPVSTRDERLTSSANRYLSTIIPVIYGAVFSYSMYVASILIIKIWILVEVKNPNWFSEIIISEYFYAFLGFIVVALYMIRDIGSIVKLEGQFHFLRSSRYTHEVFIAFLYMVTYTFILHGNYLAVPTFALVIFWGGIWCNQVKEEYYKNEKLSNFMASMVGLQFFGFTIFMAQATFFLYTKRTILFNFESTITFIISLFLWQLAVDFWMVYTHGNSSNDFTLTILLPDFIIRKGEK